MALSESGMGGKGPMPMGGTPKSVKPVKGKVKASMKGRPAGKFFAKPKGK